MNFLVADDHPLCVAMVALAIRQYHPDAEIFEAETLESVLTQLERLPVRCLVLDLSLKDCSGLVGLARIRALYPELPVLVLSASRGPAIARNVHLLGARAYLSKDVPRSEIAKTICRIARTRGRARMDACARTLSSQKTISSDETVSSREEAFVSTQVPNPLSRAQLRVLPHLLEGRSNSAIGEHLGLQLPTIKSHCRAIYRALGVSSRSQAIIEMRKS